MANVFLSYSREDKQRAQELAEAFEREGLSVWWDQDIPPGKTWDEVIGRELDGAKCVVVLWTSTSVASDWVKEEAARAKKRGTLVPVLLEAIEQPLGFGRVEAAELADWDGAPDHPELQTLLRAVSAQAGSAGTPPPPQPPVRPAPTRRISTPARLLGIAAVVALAGLGWKLWRPERVEVPDLLGLEVAAAESELDEAGLVRGELTREFDGDRPLGTVTAQNPESGAELEKGDAVHLTANSEPVDVPDVSGGRDLSLEAARSRLVSAGLAVGPTSDEIDDALAPGTVLRQDPAAGGDPIPAGSAVALVLSSKTPLVDVPDVSSGRDHTLEAARSKLVSAGLAVGPTSDEIDDALAPGTVLRQNPAAGGDPVPAGSAVALVLSSKTPLVDVPDVSSGRDHTLEAARSRLVSAGLAVGPTSDEIDDALAPGTVLRQNPAAGGDPVPAGSVVALVLSRKTPPVDVPSFSTVDEATQWLGSKGLEHQIQQVEHSGPAGELLGQDPAPGPVPPGTLVTLSVSKACVRTIRLSGTMDLSDHEDFGSNEICNGLGLGGSVRLTANESQVLFDGQHCCGGEVLGKLRVEAKLSADGSARVWGYLHQYESDSCPNSDLDGSRPIDVTIPDGGSEKIDLKVRNDAEDVDNDFVRISVTVTNTP